MYRKIAFIVIWYFVAAFTPSFAATNLPYIIEVAGISKGLKDSTVTSKDQDQKFTISDPKFASLVELIQPGDRIDAVLDSNNTLLIKDLKISKPCKGSTRSLALFVSFRSSSDFLPWLPRVLQKSLLSVPITAIATPRFR